MAMFPPVGGGPSEESPVDGLTDYRKGQHDAAMAALLAAGLGAPVALADAVYSAAVAWSAAAGAWLAVAGWSDDAARKMSARADSAVWTALALGGGGGRGGSLAWLAGKGAA